MSPTPSLRRVREVTYILDAWLEKNNKTTKQQNNKTKKQENKKTGKTQVAEGKGWRGWRGGLCGGFPFFFFFFLGEKWVLPFSGTRTILGEHSAACEVRMNGNHEGGKGEIDRSERSALPVLRDGRGSWWVSEVTPLLMVSSTG